MNKTLVTFFSATGTTKKVAENIKEAVNADLVEITPTEKYTNLDLDWNNKNSRSSLEMEDKNSRPNISNENINLDNYETIIIGFPVWWYTAPRIINTFIEKNNLENKKVYIFVTSGGSGASGSLSDLRNTYPNINFIDAKRFNGYEAEDEIKNWINN